MVRLWSEAVEEQKRWMGRVQHVLSGETRAFHDWLMLVDLLLEMLETDPCEAEQRDLTPKTGNRLK
jgi:hypothetical protein